MKFGIDKSLKDFFKKYMWAILGIFGLSFILNYFFQSKIQQILYSSVPVFSASAIGGATVGISFGAVVVILCLVLLLIPRKVHQVSAKTGRQLATKRVSLQGAGAVAVISLLILGGWLVGISFIIGLFADLFGEVLGKWILLGLVIAVLYKLITKGKR